MSELKQCPLCAGTSRISSIDFTDDGNDWYPECPECGLTGPAAGTEEEAAAIWNTRPAEDELLDVVKELYADWCEEQTIAAANFVEEPFTPEDTALGRKVAALIQKHRPGEVP